VLDVINSIVCRPDGSVLVGGYVNNDKNAEFGRGEHNFGVARLRGDGSFDTTFGDRGTAVVTFRGRSYRDRAVTRRNSSVHGLAVDDRGRIIAVGGEDGAFDVARLMGDGTLDTTFGSGGEAAIYADRRRNSSNYEIPGGPFFSAVAIRATDGEIFATGGSPRKPSADAGGPLIVAAFKPDGQLDQRFARGGAIQMSVNSAAGDPRQAAGNNIVLLPTGKILISGTFGGANFERTQGLLLTRLNANGSPDASFGTNLANAPGSNASDALRYIPTIHRSDGGGEVTWDRLAAGLIPAARGRFIVPLNGALQGTLYDRLMCLRFNSDGSIDDSYGAGGSAIVPFSVADSATPSRLAASAETSGEAYVTLQSDREGFVASVDHQGTVSRRLTGSLVLDDQANRFSVVQVQPDGKVLVEERRDDGSVDLLRYKVDGSIDQSWGKLGRVHFAKALDPASIRQILIRRDGSIVVDVFRANVIPFMVRRADTLYLLDSSGTVTASHEMPQVSAPLVTTSIFAGMALAPDDKVVISTSDTFWNFGAADNLGVLRLNQDLSTDVTFGNSGTVDLTTSAQFTGTTLFGSFVDPILVFPDSKVLVAGVQTHSANGAKSAVLVRLDSSGKPDPHFADHGILRIPESDRIRTEDLLLQSDGAFLVAAHDSRHVMWLSRYNEDGSKDLSFGNGGATTLPRGSSLIALTQTPAGQMLVVAGITTPGQRMRGAFNNLPTTTFVSRVIL
jgi:uncharacterized delta-60 repeat protein